MKELRISILQGAFLPVPPMFGGAVEKMWLKIGQELALRGQSVAHVSRSFAGLPAEEMIGGVRHVRVRGATAARSVVALKLQDLLYTFRALRVLPLSDIVVTNTFWAPILLLFIRRGKVYVDFARLPKGQVPLYLKSARLRVPSRAAAKAVIESCPAAEAITRVIPNALPFDPGEFAFQEKERRILFTGRIHAEKGLDLLLQAFRMAADRPAGNGWSLDIVGPCKWSEGGAGEKFESQLRQAYPHDAITWHGPVHDEAELNGFYKRAAIFCYPSVAGETFGLAPLEAMAWGCVPVVSGLACFNDFIRDQENGVVVDHRAPDAAARLAATLEDLMVKRSFREQLGQRAMAVRETHSAGRITGMFMRDFEELMSLRPAVAARTELAKEAP